MLCRYYNFTSDELEILFKDKESRYLLVLLLNKYNCLNKEKLVKEMKFKSVRSIDYTLKKAEERLLFNKEFRKSYFDVGENIQNKT